MLGDLAVNRFAVIVIVGERIVDCCERQMRVVLQKLFRRLPVQQRRDHDRAYGDACARETGTASADLGITDDIGVGAYRHRISVPDFYPHGNLSGPTAVAVRLCVGDERRRL